MQIPTASLILGGLAVALAVPATVRADVMAVDENGAQWISGGPAQPHTMRPATPRNSTMPVAWRGTIAALSAQYDLSPAIIEALIWQESRWRTGAVSPKGARGLAQLMPQTARDMGANPDNPVENVAAGARYLRHLVNTFHGNLELALAADNAGPRRVARAGKVPPIAETRGYVAAIMARLAAQSTSGR